MESISPHTSPYCYISHLVSLTYHWRLLGGGDGRRPTGIVVPVLTRLWGVEGGRGGGVRQGRSRREPNSRTNGLHMLERTSVLK